MLRELWPDKRLPLMLLLHLWVQWAQSVPLDLSGQYPLLLLYRLWVRCPLWDLLPPFPPLDLYLQ